MTDAALTIRPATTGDAPAIQSIYAPIVEKTIISFEETPPDVPEMARRIADSGARYPYLVADRDGHLLGYAYASAHRSRSAYRRSVDVTVYVDPAGRRQGVGRTLYGALLPELARRGFHAAFAGIALPNDASVGLHEALGFRPVGIFREVGFKFGQWRDVGWWQYRLPDADSG